MASLQRMYKTEGIIGLFRGNNINCGIKGPFTVLEFYGYEFFKNALFPGFERDEFDFS